MAQVLVVDDALIMRRTIGGMLEKNGHTVAAEAGNGVQAVEAYRQHRPDLVTMDITMPGMDGIEALKQIVALDPAARVMIVSALGQQHKVFDALQYGAKSYILKPFKEERLISVINDILENRTCGDFVSERLGNRMAEPEDKLPPGVDLAAISLPHTAAFASEEAGESLKVTVVRQFMQRDFAELSRLMAERAASGVGQFSLDLTKCQAVNDGVAPGFADLLEKLVLAGLQVQVSCHTQDYLRFFRNVPALGPVEFTLLKK